MPFPSRGARWPMWAVDALARYLWEQGEGVDVYTGPLEPPATALLALGLMDERGRPLRGAPSLEEVRA
jgi:hypothetical protein